MRHVGSRNAMEVEYRHDGVEGATARNRLKKRGGGAVKFLVVLDWGEEKLWEECCGGSKR